LATVKEAKKTDSEMSFILTPKPSSASSSDIATNTTTGGSIGGMNDKQKPLALKVLKDLRKSKEIKEES